LKQYDIFKRELSLLKKDPSVTGALLIGSVAAGTAGDNSDLDILVLSDKDEFLTKSVDGILVEITYLTYETAVKKLEANPMDLYHYLGATIEYDTGRLAEILNLAFQKYHAYQTSDRTKTELQNWLCSTKIKLTAAISENDDIMARYIVYTNSWKVLEGMWAVNNKPMPPSSWAYRHYTELRITPYSNWFECLFSDNINHGTVMLQIIDWLLPQLK
jgi:predicted nucleotidyltransferase